MSNKVEAERSKAAPFIPADTDSAGFDLNEEGPVALPRFGVMNAAKPA